MSDVAADRDPDLPKESLKYARGLLTATREELVRADTKAALLFAASGIAIGALLNGLLGGKWSPSELANSVEWIWWVGVGAASSALVCLAMAIYPRTIRTGERPKLISYYGDVMNLPRDLLAENLAATPKKMNYALVDQIYQASWIVARKYLLIRAALWLFLAAATFTISPVVLSLVVLQ